MSYVDKSLTQGESVIHRAKIHWFVFVPGATLFIVGLALAPTPATIVAGICLILGALSLIKAAVRVWTTELAVTNKRVIAKVGLIRRSTIELNHAKVESYVVDQSIMGRLIGYGTVFVCGTGGNKTGVPGIAAPLEFRRHAMGASDAQISPAATPA